MNHEDAAHLLSQVIPLITDGKTMNGPLGTAGKNAWRSLFNGEELSMEARSCEIVRDSTHVRAVANLATVFPIDLSSFAGLPRNAATTRAAVRLAVSRLYDGPQAAPMEASSLPKVALCTERGCSETRTEGQLCASHARRAETYAREARAEKLKEQVGKIIREKAIEVEVAPYLVPPTAVPTQAGELDAADFFDKRETRINLAKACADGSRIDEALGLARRSVQALARASDQRYEEVHGQPVSEADVKSRPCARCGAEHRCVFACEACWWLFLRRAGGTKAGIGGSHQETQQRFAEWARANPVASAAPQGIVRRDYEAALMGTDPAGIRAAEAYAFAISAPPKLVPQGLLLAVRAIIGSPHSEGLLAGGLGINAWYKVAPGISPSDVGKTVFLKGGRLELAESLPPRPGTAGRCKTPRCSRKPAAGLAWADGQWCEIHQLEARSEAFTRETMGGPEPTGEEQLRLRQKIDAKIPEFSSLVASGGMGGSGAAG